MRSGLRRSKRKQNKKELKYRVSQFHQIIDALEEVAERLYEDNPDIKEVTEQWVKEKGEIEMGRELDNMEVMVIASRVWHMIEKEEE